MSQPLDNETKKLLKELATTAADTEKRFAAAVKLVNETDSAMAEIDKEAKA